MKRLPKYTPAEVRNDPYGFTYKEMSEVIGENEAKALYEELYKQLPRKKNLSMLVKNICKSSDTEKYVYELKDNKYIETVFIKRRDGGTVCVSTQVGCPVVENHVKFWRMYSARWRRQCTLVYPRWISTIWVRS